MKILVASFLWSIMHRAAVINARNFKRQSEKAPNC